MKVLLIRPRNVYNYNNYPPLGLISLGSSLEAQGHRVQIINCALEKAPLWRIANELWGTDLVGISFLTSEVPDAYLLLKNIRTFTEVPIVAGGIHPTLFPEQVQGSGLVDYTVVGEGERYMVLIAVCMSLPRAQPDLTIYPKRLVDLESLPVPNYSLDEKIETFISSPLTDPLSARVKQPMRWLPYESSRGCPHRCTFCINTVADNSRWRAKSAEKVVAEVKEIVERYRLTHIKFVDDDFFVDIGRARRICEGLTRAQLSLTWDAECRCDYFNNGKMNDATLIAAKRSGLVQLTLGLESGSLHTLGLMNKGIEPGKGEYAVSQCDEFGILARSSFMLEVPGETLKDIKQTISFINKLRQYPNFVCGVTTFRPYPRCELTRDLLKSGQLEQPKTFRDWAHGDAVKLYTAAEYARPWQVSPKYSERAAYFLTLESATRLGDHQLDSLLQKLINRAFRFLAKLRNRLGFYSLPLDKSLYERFLTRFYRKKETCAQR